MLDFGVCSPKCVNEKALNGVYKQDLEVNLMHL